MLVDSHCHLCFPGLRERSGEILERMHAAGIGMALNICTTIEESADVVGFAGAHEGLYATVGVHPDNLDVIEPDVAMLVDLASRPKVVGIGETGLDYYRLPEPLDWQRERFRTHIRAARAARKPLIIHTRASAADTLRILREEGASEVGGVMHCFTEDAPVARAALDLGFYISFSGIVTFKSASALREVARMVPADRILVETDSPYLAPVPMRGQVNEPAFVAHVAQCVAAVREVPVETLAQQTTENFLRLFNILDRYPNVIS